MLNFGYCSDPWLYGYFYLWRSERFWLAFQSHLCYFEDLVDQRNHIQHKHSSRKIIIQLKIELEIALLLQVRIL